jgi:BirA family transcriptional regulator, biotin operon repressor / biotin---[acetyl-CoA-carboxylase] ligase
LAVFDPALLALLADGQWHSGQALGARLGKTRAAIWKGVTALREVGLAIEAGPGRGYRWLQAAELLERRALEAALARDTRARLCQLDLEPVCDSTSARLLAAAAPEPGQARVCLAEYQTGGRGRRGRRWQSPPASGLCLSVSWSFAQPPAALSGLGLAAGVIVAEALEAMGATGLGLKWPNDLVTADGKLAGILVDVSGDPAGPLRVVIGLGLNLRLPPGLVSELAREPGSYGAAALDALLPGIAGRRNLLAARLVDALVAGLGQFARDGFPAFADRWRGRDVLAGRPVRVSGPGGSYDGVARGIDADGALLLEREGELQTLLSGDASLRTEP